MPDKDVALKRDGERVQVRRKRRIRSPFYFGERVGAGRGGMSGGRERVRLGKQWRPGASSDTKVSPVLSDGPPPHKDFAGESGLPSGLARTIQAEIVPRLMLAHRGGTAAPSGEPAYAATPPSMEDIAELARLIIAHDSTLGLDYVEAMRMKGMSVESVFVDLLTPTARLLGELWMEDDCTFTDVTIGLSRLHRMVGDLSSAFSRELEFNPLPGPRAALIAAPGEQHTFGLHLVREFFRREGWDVWAAPTPHTNELVHLVQDEWINLVGVSMSGPESAPRVAELIRDVRAASLNPNLFILVGGACIIDDDKLAAKMGADAGPADAKEALALARSHFDQLGSSRERH